MFTLFVEGSADFMTLLTIILIALLLAAWKAPAWVREIGIIALVVGVLGTLMGFYSAARVLEQREVTQLVIWGGLRVMVISLIYGLLIYLVSLIIRIIQKPRI